MTPHVTQITGLFRDDLAAIPAHILDPATERGRTVHKIIHAKCLDLWVPEIQEDCKGFIESWQKFADRFIEKVIFVEREFVHPFYKYTGTIDFYGLLREGLGRCLLDWKTPVQHQKAWLSQLSAYDNAARSEGYQVDRIGSLQLNRDGKIPKMVWLENSTEAFNAFLGGLTAWHYFKG